MFHCVILFRLKAGITLDRVRGARTALQALVESLPGVEHFAVTHNLVADGQGYNLVLFSAFENRSACEVCLRHPEFRRVWDEDLTPLVAQHLMVQGEPEA